MATKKYVKANQNISVQNNRNKNEHKKMKSVSISEFVSKLKLSKRDGEHNFEDLDFDEFILENERFSKDEIMNPRNKMYNFWVKFKLKYKISNLTYWLDNIDINIQRKVLRKRKKVEQNLYKRLSKQTVKTTAPLNIKLNNKELEIEE
ncbi:hypothetical protein [Spiroplasma endosymbiont of Aspidapion aeneum]|uniref:hypothetical protein n=1 Tax=Spiroplasma endosymbiont of Aspidapion aeneum TaxID=3066276 RepID=UPI00313CFB98